MIKIKEAEEKASLDLEKAEKDKVLLIEEAKLKALAMKEEVVKDAKRKYDEAIEAFYSTKSEEELVIIKNAEKDIKELEERELRNMERTADIILDEFVRYIDAKSEEDV